MNITKYVTALTDIQRELRDDQEEIVKESKAAAIIKANKIQVLERVWDAISQCSDEIREIGRDSSSSG